jgi:hypothetical protein
MRVLYDDRKQEVINKRVSEDVVLDLGDGDRIIGIEIQMFMCQLGDFSFSET